MTLSFIETKEEVTYIRNSAPVVPHSWYHICVGIDTNSGLLRIVDNGVLTFDGKKDSLKNAASVKPKTVAGKLLGKSTFIENKTKYFVLRLYD